MNYIEGTGITHEHHKKLKALADKYKVPVYVFGSRAREFHPDMKGKDLDIAFVVDNPVHEKIVGKKYEEMSKETRLIDDVQHNPLIIYLEKIPKLFPDTYKTIQNI